MVTQSTRLSSSVSNVALGEPFLSNPSCMVGIPVLLPSVRSSSFRNSPRRLFLYSLLLKHSPFSITLRNRSVNPRKAGNKNVIRFYFNLHQFVAHVIPMIKGVSNSFLQNTIRIAHETICLHPIRDFLDKLLDSHILKFFHRTMDNLRHGSFDRRYLDKVLP